jgi:hypothetical protein
MRAIHRAAWCTGLALAACVMNLPATATAQGKYPKPGTVERKIERKSDQKVAQKIRRTTRRGTIVERRRILCGDGTWALSGAACANHDGVAARQVEVRRVTPVASVRARERANAHSAVARSAYVNRTRAGAIARCVDGTYWHARTRTSACANHGGVANWL